MEKQTKEIHVNYPENLKLDTLCLSWHLLYYRKFKSVLKIYVAITRIHTKCLTHYVVIVRF